MNKLFTTVLVLILVLATSAAGALLYLGKEVEKRFDAAVGRWDATEYLSVKKTDYTKSFFGAEAITQVGLEGSPYFASFRHAIRYPPMARGGLIEVTTTMEPPDVAKKEMAQLFGSAPPLTLKTALQWDGGAATELSSPPFKTHSPGMGRVEWGGVQGTLHVHGQRIQAKMNMPGMKIDGTLFDLKMNTIVLSMDVTKANDGLWIGNTAFELGLLEGVGPLEKSVSLKGLRFAQSVEEGAPGLLKIGMSADSRQIAAENFNLQNAGYEVQLSRLDRSVLSALVKRVRKSTRLLSQEQAIALAASMRGELPKLLKRSPRITVKRVGFTLPAGTFKADVTAEFSSQGEMDWDSPVELFSLWKGKGHIEIAKPLLAWMIQQEMREPARLIGNAGKEESRWSEAQVERFATAMSDMRIARSERNGQLVEKGGSYVMDVKFESGALTLNNKAITNPIEILN